MWPFPEDPIKEALKIHFPTFKGRQRRQLASRIHDAAGGILEETILTGISALDYDPRDDELKRPSPAKFIDRLGDVIKHCSPEVQQVIARAGRDISGALIDHHTPLKVFFEAYELSRWYGMDSVGPVPLCRALPSLLHPESKEHVPAFHQCVKKLSRNLVKMTRYNLVKDNSPDSSLKKDIGDYNQGSSLGLGNMSLDKQRLPRFHPLSILFWYRCEIVNQVRTLVYRLPAVDTT